MKSYVIQDLDEEGQVIDARRVGGSDGTDPDAVHYTEDSGKTDAEKEQAQKNLDLEGGSVTAAAVASAIGDMSAAQASQALSDLGGEPAPTEVFDLSSTSITLSATANTIYQCGELSSLTITNPPATGAWSVVFTSGATATTTTIPASILGLEDFAPAANTLYEINVLDNRAVWRGWPLPEVTNNAE